jgi:biotin operon repressor
MDLGVVIAQLEDHLFRLLEMTVCQRSLYYHLLRHTRLLGEESRLFAIDPLANALRVSEFSIRRDIRALHAKGCIQIEGRSHRGHQIRVLLPLEIPGIVPSGDSPEPVDLGDVDFFSGRRFVEALLARQDGLCFYCSKGLRATDCQLDHVVPRASGEDHSYRNVVAACHECNTTKQERHADDFVRWLYRRGVLSQPELEGRLAALAALQAGELVPDLAQQSEPSEA